MSEELRLILAPILAWTGLAALLTACVLMMAERRLAARGATVIAVLLICGWGLTHGLRKGIDLEGGTSLLYEVDLRGMDDPESVLQQVIKIYSGRVDPTGTANIQWRVEGNNRIELQIPLAKQVVRDRRTDYEAALKELDKKLITRENVLDRLRMSGAARDKALSDLAAGVPGRLQRLQEAAEAADRRAEALAEHARVKREDPDNEPEAGGVAAKADTEFEAAVDAVMTTNLDRFEVERVLARSSVRPIDEETGKPGLSERDIELAKLSSAHADRSLEIAAIAKAHEAYMQVKGPYDSEEDVIRMLRGAGVLEFRITVDPAEAPDAADLLKGLREQGPLALNRGGPRKWFALHSTERFADSAAQKQMLEQSPEAFFAGRQLIGGKYADDYYILLWDTPERSLTQVAGQRESWQLTRAYATPDDRNFPAVGFQMDDAGGRRMGELTGGNVGRRMAILLDDQVYSYPPNINSRITGSGIITGGAGGFSQGELEYLTRTLNAGSLTAKVHGPVSVNKVGPQLGRENLQHGLEAAYVSLVVITIFMLVYYFVGGLVANVALFANLLIVLGVMSLLRATFTLPGIAGVVLTIGMAVDANVLVFERIREELIRGRDMLTSLRLGYAKAFSSILDGNVTNLIVCVILGYTATAEIKGFAVTLGIGIMATLFASLFMTRTIFDIYYRNGGTRRLTQLPLAVPAIDRAVTPRIDWVAKRRIFYTVSIAALVLSVALVFARGSQLLDIEFRGGTQVEFTFKDGVRKTRNTVADDLGKLLPDASVVAMGDVTAEGAARFSVLTTEPDRDKVAEAIRDAYLEELDVQPVVHFTGEQFKAAANARTIPGDVVIPITSPKIGEVINRPEVANQTPGAIGGVAIVLDNLDPTVTREAIRERLRVMRSKPDFQSEQFRPLPEVIGLTSDPDHPDRWKSVVVVAHDPQVSWLQSPEAWESELALPEWNLVNAALGEASALGKVTNFSPAVARTMTYNAIVALLLSIVAIVAYIWFRFGSLRYGMVAIAALVHDVTIALGALALAGFIYDAAGPVLLLAPFKINMAIIAALMTIIGYSLNDTIIVLDRIRENRGKLAIASPAIINESINQTVSRTVITSGTTCAAVLILYCIGGPGVHAFAFAMVVGIGVGTYSSIAVAAPMLLIGTPFTGSAPPPPSPPADRKLTEKVAAVAER